MNKKCSKKASNINYFEAEIEMKKKKNILISRTVFSCESTPESYIYLSRQRLLALRNADGRSNKHFTNCWTKKLLTFSV